METHLRTSLAIIGDCIVLFEWLFIFELFLVERDGLNGLATRKWIIPNNKKMKLDSILFVSL